MAKMRFRVDNLLAALQRLSRREKFMVIGLAGSLLLFVGTLLSLWIGSSLGNLERRIDDKTGKLQALIDLRAEFEEAKQVQKVAERTLREGRNLKLMAAMEGLAHQLGVNIEDMQRRSPTVDSETNVAENKVEVNIRQITIDRLVQFLEEIERKSKTVAVRKLRVKRNFQQPDQLEVNFTVSNYELLEDKAEEPAAPAAPAPPLKGSGKTP